jgi:pimeloyl-ACP methyl ester carboxylesterase
MSATALRLLRPLVRVSSLLAPRAAGHLAFRAFCTPPRPRQEKAQHGGPVKAGRDRLGAARRLSVPFTCGAVTAYAFDPPGVAPEARHPSVLLLHGWSGQAAFMTAFVAPLLAAGFRVVAYDLPGHGSSTGRELNVPIGVASLAAVARVFAPVHAIVAHSFGGSIAMAALARTVPVQPRVRAGRLALIAAPSSLTEVTRGFGATIGLGRRGQAALERRIHVVAGAPVQAFEGGQQLAAVGLPTLVVHCRDDREVGFAHAEALSEAGPFVRLEPFAGLGHRRILRSVAVVDAVTGFVVG